jgi:hypothetical protein
LENIVARDEQSTINAAHRLSISYPINCVVWIYQRLRLKNATAGVVVLSMPLALCPNALAGLLEDLDEASPAAAALLWQKAPGLEQGSQNRQGPRWFHNHHEQFPEQGKLSIDDMTACINEKASTAVGTTAVRATNAIGKVKVPRSPRKSGGPIGEQFITVI